MYKLLLAQLLKKETYIFVVALLSGSVVGVCHICVTRRDGVLIGDYGIVLDESVRGIGLGKRLSMKALSLAKRLGVGEVYLRVDVDNERAIKLYGSLGFKVCGHSYGFRYTSKEYIRQYVMRLRL